MTKWRRQKARHNGKVTISESFRSAFVMWRRWLQLVMQLRPLLTAYAAAFKHKRLFERPGNVARGSSHTHTHTHTRGEKKKKTGGNQTIAIGNRRRWWRGRRWRHLLPPINKSAGNNYPYLVRGGETSEENDPNRPPAALRISNRWRELQFKWNR